MLHQGIQFHNVADLERQEDIPGLSLQRYPRELRDQLGREVHVMGRRSSTMSSGCEIRFVTSARIVWIYLSASFTDAEIAVYHGDYFHSLHTIKVGGVVGLQLEKSERLYEIQPDALNQGRFSPDVWRIVACRGIGGLSSVQVRFHSLDSLGHEVRAPLPEELPAVRWLAYGSSITMGAGAIHQHNTYVQHAARKLGVDVYNKGLSGACHCEPETTAFLSSLEWDVATLELGINMRTVYKTEEFRQRAEHLVRALLDSQPGKPIFLITIFPNRANYFFNQSNPYTLANNEFNEQLRDIHRLLDDPNLHLIEGSDILTDFSGLTSDLVHPSDYGHILMGERLAERMKPVLRQFEEAIRA
ncbi:SGNH/GDSL hydrolase family protein [Paenibacillus koleovorans]|uniref:SGNH/GDSL hydrolase family protein n=1 Tax=Paenibacillus koleovorans TaxID=121608 RepID=UPI000FDC1DFB|nr:SGNH/GDSL hydrolase family protein [Paenibacillus koleovorans]